MLITKISREQFLNYFSNYIEVKEILEKNNIPFAIFAGTEVWLLTNSRIPTDLDILVRDEDMNRVVQLFKQSTKIKSKDGVYAKYILNNNIEIVSEIKITKNNQIIEIPLNNTMLEKIIRLELGTDLELPLLAVEDTIIIKYLLKRGESEGKFDLEDINSLKNVININSDYLRKRAREINAEKYLKSI